MSDQSPIVPRHKPGPEPRPELREEDLQGFKFFRRVRRLVATLHGCAAHPNRCLFYDEYATLLLFYFFNPAITSLRGLQRASGFGKVQRVLGLRRMSLGSMSESVRLFDPALLAALFERLAAASPGRLDDPRLREVKETITACDGSVFRALPRMAWALWLGEADRGVRAHVQFDVARATAVRMDLGVGNSSEVAALRARLEAGRLYVLDRGYRAYDLLQDILDAGSSFVIRLHDNLVYEVIDERPLADAAGEAGVTLDAIVRLGSPAAREKLTAPVRLVRLHVPKRPARGPACPARRVASTKARRRERGEADDLWIATDRLDLDADLIALIYRHRWKIELFFRLIKSVFGCRHLLSDSLEGVSIQLYGALIASLLLAEYTGRRPAKRVFELLALYLQGWVDDDELREHLARLGAARRAKNG